MRGTQNPPLTSWGCRGMPATPVMLRHGKIVCNAVIAYREVCRVSRVSESECGGRLCSSGRKPREHNHTAGMMNHGTGQSIKISLFFRRCAVFFGSDEWRFVPGFLLWSQCLCSNVPASRMPFTGNKAKGLRTKRKRRRRKTKSSSSFP